MSIFNSINICSPKPQMLSLQEESPEIPSKAKKLSTDPSLFNKNKSFPLSKTIFPQQKQQSLLLSYEIAESESLPSMPINEESIAEETQKFIFKTFKNDDELSLGEKIAFSYFLNMNKSY